MTGLVLQDAGSQQGHIARSSGGQVGKSRLHLQATGMVEGVLSEGCGLTLGVGRVVRGRSAGGARLR